MTFKCHLTVHIFVLPFHSLVVIPYPHTTQYTSPENAVLRNSFLYQSHSVKIVTILYFSTEIHRTIYHTNLEFWCWQLGIPLCTSAMLSKQYQFVQLRKYYLLPSFSLSYFAMSHWTFILNVPYCWVVFVDNTIR